MFRKEILTILVGMMLVGVYPAKADLVWTSGHHEIREGDVHAEIYMYNDATAKMVGGDVLKLEVSDAGRFEMLGGEMIDLRLHDSSVADLHGGVLDRLGITESGHLNLYGYDITYHETGGHYDRGWIEGTFIASDSYFNFDFVEPGTFSHINVVPEPATLLLVGIGTIFLKKRG